MVTLLGDLSLISYEWFFRLL